MIELALATMLIQYQPPPYRYPYYDRPPVEGYAPHPQPVYPGYDQPGYDRRRISPDPYYPQNRDYYQGDRLYREYQEWRR